MAPSFSSVVTKLLIVPAVHKYKGAYALVFAETWYGLARRKAGV
jgi:hypothetical protein